MNITRRDMMKTTATIGVATMITGGTAALAQQAEQPAAATESEKKLPVIVTNVVPRATIPMIAPERTTFRRLSTVRKPLVDVAP